MDGKRQRSRSPFAASLVVSSFVCVGILGIRSLGGLEAMELAVYDWCIRAQIHAALPASQIVVISVDESDIRRQGSWPLTDASLAETLQILMEYQPRVIGVDILRDLPVPPGGQTLAK